MKPNTGNLIEQVNWLLARMSRGQILRVFSYANRIFVSEGGNDALQRADLPLHTAGGEDIHPETGTQDSEAQA